MSVKYEYKFVRIADRFFGYARAKEVAGYRSVIEQHANLGWRFVQIFRPVGIRGIGKPFDLIFERIVDPDEDDM